MTDRTIILNASLYRVPFFIHRTFANGGGWCIGVPGVKYELSDADNGGTANALELIKEEFKTFLKFEPEFMERVCGLTLLNEDDCTKVTVRSGEYVCVFASISIYGVAITPLVKNGFNSPELKAAITIENWTAILERWIAFCKEYVLTPGGYDFKKKTRELRTDTRVVTRRV